MGCAIVSAMRNDIVVLIMLLQFLHPVPRSEGFEMVLSQFDGNYHCYFTSLLNYKVSCDWLNMCVILW